MSDVRLEEVFGVSKDQVLSYVERERVDGLFSDGLHTDKQLIVYGASKQGKTSLVDKHVPYEQNIVVSLTPKYGLIDIYKTILRNAGLEIETSTVSSSGSKTQTSVGAKVKAMIPFFGDTEMKADMTKTASNDEKVTRESIELNLELPNDVTEGLKKVGTGKL